MRMLTYYHETLENNQNENTNRSNLSSAESINSRLNKKIGPSPESVDTVGHQKNDIKFFKPFKNEKHKEENKEN